MTGPPATRGLGVAVFWIDRSALGAALTAKEALLFVRAGSAVVEDAVAVLVTVPVKLGGIVATI